MRCKDIGLYCKAEIGTRGTQLWRGDDQLVERERVLLSSLSYEDMSYQFISTGFVSS